MKGGQKDEFLCFRQIVEIRGKKRGSVTFSASAMMVLGTVSGRARWELGWKVPRARLRPARLHTFTDRRTSSTLVKYGEAVCSETSFSSSAAHLWGLGSKGSQSALILTIHLWRFWMQRRWAWSIPGTFVDLLMVELEDSRTFFWDLRSGWDPSTSWMAAGLIPPPQLIPGVDVPFRDLLRRPNSSAVV